MLAKAWADLQRADEAVRQAERARIEIRSRFNELLGSTAHAGDTGNG